MRAVAYGKAQGQNWQVQGAERVGCPCTLQLLRAAIGLARKDWIGLGQLSGCSIQWSRVIEKCSE
ncbi:hypothetical protein NP554_20965 [Pseudomonas asiatica]|uniref:Uncharacterized protein n=1 Tax=Pseudomonas asiatica TaxID=2219225 RepID=A0A9X4DDQ1_9PSED|nr:hypothetical protein [Pseudomonas asiatica]MDD2114255.1 hypothetical protein [Pseudomonas asiatica]WJN49411.1 hypothetical protein QUR91_22595 [Pseudomonas asiatica]